MCTRSPCTLQDGIPTPAHHHLKRPFAAPLRPLSEVPVAEPQGQDAEGREVGADEYLLLRMNLEKALCHRSHVGRNLDHPPAPAQHGELSRSGGHHLDCAWLGRHFQGLDRFPFCSAPQSSWPLVSRFATFPCQKGIPRTRKVSSQPLSGTALCPIRTGFLSRCSHWGQWSWCCNGGRSRTRCVSTDRDRPQLLRRVECDEARCSPHHSAHPKSGASNAASTGPAAIPMMRATSAPMTAAREAQRLRGAGARTSAPPRANIGASQRR